MFIPEITIDQIRDANDIVEVISGYIPLKKRGREFVAICPFHNEKTPSFTVIPHKQIFYCFGCHKGGDVFKFLCDYENISYPEAIKRLADRVGIEIQFEKKEGISRSIKDALFHIQEEFTQYWHEQLLSSPEGQVARNYLQQRQVAPESIRDFRLGYSPLAWEDTPNQALARQLDLKQVADSGLAIFRDDQRSAYGRFRGRLMFPIADDQGRVIGFSARVLYPERDKMGKYVNSPETPLFHKSHVVFGLDKAKREIIQKNCAIVCEGQLDLITCHAAGYRNVVAPQGTAFTAPQARILKRFAPEVILCFDGDEPGQNAAVKALDVLVPAGLNMKVAFLPDNLDPDSFIKAKGADAFGDFLNHAQEFFDFYLSRLCRKHNKESDSGRLQIVQLMGEALLKANQPLLTDTYARKTAQVLEVNPQTILDEFKRCKPASRPEYHEVPPPAQTNPNTNPEAHTPSNQEEEFNPPSKREQWLLKLFLICEAEWDILANCFQAEWIEHPLIRKIIVTALDIHNAGEYSVHTLLSSFPDPQAQEILCEALAQNTENIPDPARQLRELILTLRSKYCDHLLRAINLQMSAPGITTPEQIDLLRQKNRIREIRTTPIFTEPVPTSASNEESNPES